MRSYTGEVYPSILIPTNSTITDRLSYGPIANSTSGVVSITVNLTESVSIVLVNPSNSTEDVVLDMSMSPLGPCQQCNKERDQNGLLGELQIAAHSTLAEMICLFEFYICKAPPLHSESMRCSERLTDVDYILLGLRYLWKQYF